MSLTHPHSPPGPPAVATDHCATCGASLAGDQRYCLNCGRACHEPRVDFSRELGLVAPDAPAGEAVPAGRSDRQLLLGGLAVMAVLVAAAVGIVIGRAGEDVAQQPPVVNITGGAPATGGTNAASVTDSWPEGSSGWTVQVRTLPKTSDPAAVQAAVADAEDAGAERPAVLDGDAHDGAPAGKYVIFSGIYATKVEAQDALDAIGGDARLLHITDGGNSAKAGGDNEPETKAPKVDESVLENQENLSGEDYVNESKKLPDELGTEGEAPPTDNGAPGGGSGGTEIG